jgi:hypothetical protein
VKIQLRAAVLAAAVLSPLPAAASAALPGGYPSIPEPMVFDMMRPLGARQGELEVNALGLQNLSGPSRTVEWAPEIEYAVTDGTAVEFELPFAGGKLEALKIGLQTAFGAPNGGRSAHGVQYLGVYDRHTRSYDSSLLYMFGHRYSDAISTMSMIGLGNISDSRGGDRNALLVNHSTFWNAAPGTVLGLELNYRAGSDESVLVMPQLHQKIGSNFAIQAGLGAEKLRNEPFRPRAGLRVIREF